MDNYKSFLTDKEFDLLYENALLGYNNAYAPYSNFKVGASILLNNGKIYYGSNIENSSYGLCNCAERTCMFKAYSEGVRSEDIKCLMVIANTKDAVSPCGACRQVMEELLGLDCYVILTNLTKKVRIFKVRDLLPYSFSGDNLNE